jgi:hypothetical protein
MFIGNKPCRLYLHFSSKITQNRIKKRTTSALVGVVTIPVRKIKKGCHEALEACAQGIANYALALMHGVQAFARMLRVPHDILRNICERNPSSEHLWCYHLQALVCLAGKVFFSWPLFGFRSPESLYPALAIGADTGLAANACAV